MHLRTVLAGAAAVLLMLTPLTATAKETTAAVTETTTTATTTVKTTAKSTTAATATAKTTAKSTTAATATAKTTAKSTTAATTTVKTTAKSTTAATTTAKTTVKSTTTAKTTAKSTKATTTTAKTTAKTTKKTTTTAVMTTTAVTEAKISGLWTDEDGNTYFYQNGETMTGLILHTPEYQAGDVEGDGIADAVDASLILNAAAGEGAEGIGAAELLMGAVPDKSADELLCHADIGSDGRIDAQDAAEILNYSALLGADQEPLPLGFAAYYADADGKLQTGFIDAGEGVIYYADERFRLQTGWLEQDGRSYYFGSDYHMLTGWQELDGELCLFYADGTAAEGFLQIESEINYFGSHGVLSKGWREIDGQTYYFDENGSMLKGITEVDGKLCRFTEHGVYKPLKLCLDAGHFAKYNRSPVVPAYWESEMTWKLHLYLKAELESYGIEVMTTRPKQEEDLGVVARGELAKGCDMFLSLHSDAIANTTADRPTAYCSISGKLNDLGTILADTVAEVMDTKQSGEIRNRVGDDDEDYYGVLRGAASVGVPGILMEHSYHTNARSAKWLLSEENLQTLAKEEAKLISDYFLS